MTRVRIALAVAAALAGVGGFLLVLNSSRQEDAVVMAALVLLVGWSFAASGLIAWQQRPDNRFGLFLVVVSFTWFAATLDEADSSVLFTIGELFGSVSLAVFLHAVLAYPRGRLESRFSRILVGLAYFDVIVLQIARLAFDDRVVGPDNLLLVSPHAELAQRFADAENALGIVIAAGLIWVLVERYRVATPMLRRALGPVLVTSALTAGLVVASIAADYVSQEAGDRVFWAALVAYATVPLAFLLGLVRSRLARAAVATLVLKLSQAHRPGDVREALRESLGDPWLDLAYWLPETQGYVDEDGEEFVLPEETPERVVTLVEHRGRHVAALVHDRSLRERPQLVDAVSAAAALALERERSLQELRRSEARYRATLNAIPDLMFRMSRDGRYVAFRAENARDLAVPPDQLIGAHVYDVVPRDVADAIMVAGCRTLETGKVETVEYTLALDGRARSFEGRAVRSSEDEFILIVRDFTEQRRVDEELRASRARLVEAADAERRRLERNLHDGAQQRLVSLSIALRLARSKLEQDPAAAAEILNGASSELTLALEELRELARGIHPAVLTDRGLPAALQSLAARAPLPVDLDQLPAERLPDQVEAAAYYVVAEALTNVAKYAQATQVHVSVTRQNGGAVIEVADDGVGGADPGRGTGLRGLLDRVEALSGSLDVASPPGRGTKIRAEIPCG